MPDFYSLLNALTPTTGLQSGLLAMFDKILQSGAVTDPVKVNAIAQVRAQIAILLKNI